MSARASGLTSISLPDTSAEQHFTCCPVSRLLFLLRTKIVEICLTVGTTDLIEMKADVLHQFVVTCTKKITAQLITCGTTDAFPPPDCPGCMFAAVFLIDYF